MNRVMLNIEKILFATDFSPPSDHALQLALELAEKFGAELHVLHVVQDLAPLVGDPAITIDLSNKYLAEARQYAQRALQSLPGERRPHAGRTIRELREGSPFVEIVRYAREMGIDLIVIGTHGRTGLKHLLLGSVAENVVRKASCPVLTVCAPNPESATS
jgi:nucleotide-binding universal stress UspA family protein